MILLNNYLYILYLIYLIYINQLNNSKLTELFNILIKNDIKNDNIVNKLLEILEINISEDITINIIEHLSFIINNSNSIIIIIIIQK